MQRYVILRVSDTHIDYVGFVAGANSVRMVAANAGSVNHDCTLLFRYYSSIAVFLF